MLLRVTGLFIAVMVLRALYFLYYYKRGKRYSDIYALYITKQDNESSKKLSEVIGQVKQLFRIAGLGDIKIPYVDAVGFGKLASGNISPADNLDNLRQDVVGVNIRLFEQAIGACKLKCIQSFNPIFWFEMLIYLPTSILSYLGIGKKSTLIKFAQLLWWLFVAFATIVGLFFNTEFRNWISEVL